MATILRAILLAVSLRRQPQERVNPESRAELTTVFPLPQSRLPIQYAPFFAPFTLGARRQTTSLPNRFPVRSMSFPILLLCQFLCLFNWYWLSAERNAEVELGTETVISYEIEALFHALVCSDILLVSLHCLLWAVDGRVDEVLTGSLVSDNRNKELFAKELLLDTLDNWDFLCIHILNLINY